MADEKTCGLNERGDIGITLNPYEEKVLTLPLEVACNEQGFGAFMTKKEIEMLYVILVWGEDRAEKRFGFDAIVTVLLPLIQKVASLYKEYNCGGANEIVKQKLRTSSSAMEEVNG